MKRPKIINWRNSIQTKQGIGFAVIILLVILSTTLLQTRMIDFAVKATQDRMRANTEYFLDTFENEIEHIKQQQLEIFNDRKLPFLTGPAVQLSEYEKRDALLSTRERLQSILQISDMIEDVILYLPKSEYRITDSSVDTMTEEDVKDMEKYLSYAKGQMNYDGEKFFLMETGTYRVNPDFTPNQVLVVNFSADKIRGSMESLNMEPGSGSFFLRNKDHLILEYSTDTPVGEAICGKLDLNGESGGSIQRTRVNGEDYLVLVGGQGSVGLFVQYVREEPIMEPIQQFNNLMKLLIVFMILGAGIFIAYTRRLIHRPIRILMEAFERVKTGNWKEHISHSAKDEFGYLYNGFNEMEDQIDRLVEQVYVQENLVQRAQMKQLQAQINPHFLYNSFFVLSRRIKRGDYDNAMELAGHLGKYFQFLTRNEADDLPLEKEMEHAKSYAAIQATRFSGRISVEIENVPEEYERMPVPRLILQPLLENAFEHGLENRIKDGILKISFGQDGEELEIFVEDNGEEVSDRALLEMQRKLDEDDDGEITGIKNIHRRLQIYFKKKAGLRIDRSQLGGVRVTIWIGKGVQKDESESVDCG